MAKINNAQVIQKLVDELKLYPSKDAIPTELAEKILPVFQVNSQDVNVDVTNNIKTKTENTIGSTQTMQVPSGKKWKVCFGGIKWVADATVDTRYVTFQIRDASDNIIFHNGATVGIGAITANQTHYTNLVQGSGIIFKDANTSHKSTIPFPKDLELLEGWKIYVYDVETAPAGDTIHLTIVYDEQDI